MRAALVKLEADHHMLLFTSHHIVCDGWSTKVLIEELSQLYIAAVQARLPDLPLLYPSANMR